MNEKTKLMRIFLEPDKYDFDKFPRVSLRKKRLFENGASYDLVRVSLITISDEDLKKSL